jgi:hypothetical protein
MKINLITKEEHATLLGIFNDYPNLRLQNKGYETLDRSKFTDEEESKFDEVTKILKKTVFGFSSFTNFRFSKNNEIEIRLQYNYNYEGGLTFIGVGYVLLDELLNGFNN